MDTIEAPRYTIMAGAGDRSHHYSPLPAGRRVGDESTYENMTWLEVLDAWYDQGHLRSQVDGFYRVVEVSRG